MQATCSVVGVVLVSLMLLAHVPGSVAVRLHAQGRWIFDQHNNQVHLACVNWYGAEEKDFVVGGLAVQSLQDIANLTTRYGFNCVRVPWYFHLYNRVSNLCDHERSVEMFVSNPILSNKTVIAKEPALFGKTAIQGFDAVCVYMQISPRKYLLIYQNHYL